MHIYQIGYFTHEESEYVQLSHKRLLCEGELSAMIESVAADAVRHTLHTYHNPYKQSAEQWLDGLQYQEVQEHVARLLCERHGFKPVEFTATWEVQGWSSVVKPDWGAPDHCYQAAQDRMERFGSAVRSKSEPDEA